MINQNLNYMNNYKYNFLHRYFPYQIKRELLKSIKPTNYSIKILYIILYYLLCNINNLVIIKL